MPMNARQPNMKKIIFLLCDITLTILPTETYSSQQRRISGCYFKSNTSGRHDKMPPSSSTIDQATAVCQGPERIAYIQLVIAKLARKSTGEIWSQLTSMRYNKCDERILCNHPKVQASGEPVSQKAPQDLLPPNWE